MRTLYLLTNACPSRGAGFSLRRALTRVLGISGILIITAAALLLAQAARSTWDGVYTEDQAKRGDSLYQQHCAKCHGVSLTGGEEAPPLAGGAFLANWNWTTMGDLAERIRTTMPPDAPGRQSRQQIADILAHVLHANNFPAGKTELPHDTELLKQIKIEAEKPGNP